MKSIFPFNLQKPLDIHRMKKKKEKKRKTVPKEGQRRKGEEEKFKIGPFDQ